MAKMAQIWATIFFLSLASPVTRYHDQLSSCTTSEKTSNPIMKKRSDGWMDIWKRAISLEHITSFFFLSGFSFTYTHKLQDCRGRERVLLQRAHLCTYLAADSNREPLVSEHKSLTTKNLNIKKTA